MKAVSLFSSGGIGDLALKKHSINIIVANELVEQRVQLHDRNFPETKMIQGDIWRVHNQIVAAASSILAGDELDFVLATPPCQGMSKNGQGKLLNGIRGGQKPKFDLRNQLIIPAIWVIKALRPKTIIFENVPEMVNTVINDEHEKPINILEYIRQGLGDEYSGKAEVIQFADYGIPQRRSRLITIYTRDANLKHFLTLTGTLVPAATHSKEPHSHRGLKPWVTVRDVIGDLPPLDGLNKRLATSAIPFHRVPVLDPKKYVWIANTPPEKGAFDNQCINPVCGYQENPIHGAARNEQGINKLKGDTPLFCRKCGHLLPRPYTVDKNGSRRIMAGYTSAYKRMSWSLPAPTLTTNLSYPSSDHKLHPDQNRVLSLYEAFLLHTLNEYEYKWEFVDGRQVPDTLITDVIGESIPPKAISMIIEHLMKIMTSRDIDVSMGHQLSLLDYID